MLKKIHCDLLDISGPNWSDITDDILDCLIENIHKQELIEEKDELFGFVGTVDDNYAVGGYFIVQYPTQLLYFSRDKTPLEDTTSPAETVLFVFFPKEGKLLLQNRRFQYLPINMEVITTKLRSALTKVLNSCDFGYILSLSPSRITVTREELIKEFESGLKVTYLSVSEPQAERIPDDFVYYNPERDRNKIIRDSRLHDYPNLKKVDLTAKQQSDLRDTHIGQDLVQSVSDDGSFQMKYQNQEGATKKIVRQKRAKYEFHLDIDEKQLTEESLQKVREYLSMDPFSNVSSIEKNDDNTQISMFGDEE